MSIVTTRKLQDNKCIPFPSTQLNVVKTPYPFPFFPLYQPTLGKRGSLSFPMAKLPLHFIVSNNIRLDPISCLVA